MEAVYLGHKGDSYLVLSKIFTHEGKRFSYKEQEVTKLQ
jgi:hypothetical protein